MQRPSLREFATIGRYYRDTAPDAFSAMKRIHGLRTLADVGRYVWECDPNGFARSLEVAR